MKYITRILLLLLVIALATATVSCGKNCKGEHKDKNGDSMCDKCGTVIPNSDPCTEHNDSDGDEKCDRCGATVPNLCNHIDDDNNARCDICGKSLIDPDKDTPEIDISRVDDGTKLL